LNCSTAKSVRHTGHRLRRLIDHHGQQERLVFCHVQHSVHREIPFATEVAFAARISIGGDRWHKERAFLDLLADRGVPGIAAAQLALVEPDFDARFAERWANAASRLCVLRGIADETAGEVEFNVRGRSRPATGGIHGARRVRHSRL
jgi:hypothetical protein